MSNPYYTRVTQFVAGELVRASEVNAELDGVEAAFELLGGNVAVSLKLPATFTGSLSIPEQTYANKIVWINGDGNLDLYEFANIAEYQTIADASAASATLASQFANADSDVQVQAGLYSAKHWALVAQAATDASGMVVAPLEGITETTVQAALYGLDTRLALREAISAADVPVVPAGGIAAIDVQAALEELDTEKVSTVNPVITGSLTEGVYTASVSGMVALQPTNNTLQLFTLTGDVTFTDSLTSGQSLLVGIDTADGLYTVDWPAGYVSKTENGLDPSLNGTGWTLVAVMKLGATLTLARVGDS